MKKNIAFSITLVLLAVLGVSQAYAQQPAGMPFEATFQGTFEITGDIGNSPLFTVAEEGEGAEMMLGNFSYTTFLPHNTARVPEGCAPNSSTGVGGNATLAFGNGELLLKRLSGNVC